MVTVNLFLPLPAPSLLSFCLPPLAYCLFQLKVHVRGLLLDEQSYYEKSNPSLRDRGVTQDLKDTEQPDVLLDTQIPSSRRIYVNEQGRKKSVLLLLLTAFYILRCWKTEA